MYGGFRKLFTICVIQQINCVLKKEFLGRYNIFYLREEKGFIYIGLIINKFLNFRNIIQKGFIFVYENLQQGQGSFFRSSDIGVCVVVGIWQLYYLEFLQYLNYFYQLGSYRRKERMQRIYIFLFFGDLVLVIYFIFFYSFLVRCSYKIYFKMMLFFYVFRKRKMKGGLVNIKYDFWYMR